MKECPNCKAVMEDDALFCGVCGTKFEIEEAEARGEETVAPEEKYCIHCGKAIEAESMFCPFCGKPQEVEEKKNNEPQPNTTEPEPQQEPEKPETEPKPEVTEEPQTEEQNDAASTQSEQPEQPKQPEQAEKPEAEEHPAYEWEEEKKSKKWLWILLALLIAGGAGWYGYNVYSEHSVSKQADPLEEAKQDSIEPATVTDYPESLINEFYKYVFGEKEMNDDILDAYLSADLKKSLWTEDYDGVYEYWRFRTTAQDYNIEVGDISKINEVKSEGNGWYIVDYLDMGYKGQTKVKVANGKIVEIKPDMSWNDWDE